MRSILFVMISILLYLKFTCFFFNACGKKNSNIVDFGYNHFHLHNETNVISNYVWQFFVARQSAIFRLIY